MLAMQVIRRLSELVLSHLCPPDVLQCTMMRCMLREIFAYCVLRNALMYLKPYSINKVSVWGLQVSKRCLRLFHVLWFQEKNMCMIALLLNGRHVKSQ